MANDHVSPPTIVSRLYSCLIGPIKICFCLKLLDTIWCSRVFRLLFINNFLVIYLFNDLHLLRPLPRIRWRAICLLYPSFCRFGKNIYLVNHGCCVYFYNIFIHGIIPLLQIKNRPFSRKKKKQQQLIENRWH